MVVVSLVVAAVASVSHAQAARSAEVGCTAPLGVGCTGLSVPAVEDAARLTFPEGSRLIWANYTDDTRWQLRAMVQVPANQLETFLSSVEPRYYPNAIAAGEEMDATAADLADFLADYYDCTQLQGTTAVQPGITRSFAVGQYSDGSWLVYVQDTQA